eukprot:c17290_g2_i1 orf=185-619(-)
MFDWKILCWSGLFFIIQQLNVRPAHSMAKFSATPFNIQQRSRIPESTDTNLSPQKLKLHAKWNEFHNTVRQLSTLIGSKPPNCQNKCSTCSPCTAVQVPTSPAQGAHMAAKSYPQHTTNVESEKYSNYKPVGWKCKCGNQLYNP